MSKRVVFTRKLYLIAFLLIISIAATSCTGIGIRSITSKEHFKKQPATTAQDTVPATSSAETTAPETKDETVPEVTDHPVESKWFDDAVFVGDSVTLKLSYYANSHPEALSKAQFFCAGSLGYASSLWDKDAEDAVHPYYQGKVELAEDSVKLTGAKKAFIMLGMNDVGLYGADGAIDYCSQLVERLRKKSPKNTVIYLQTVTPILKGKERGDLTNEHIQEFNRLLEDFCAENNCKFLDIYSVMEDENGYLKSEYCGDPEAQGIHFTDAACRLWVEYLKDNV